LATVVVGGFGVLAGCGGADSAQPASSVIRLGTFVPLTGDNAHSGQTMLTAQRLAVDEANEAGGVLGRRVELVVEDDACDAGTAVVAAGKLVSADITVAVGGYCSSATVPTLKVFRDAGVPMVVPLSNSTDMLAPGYDSVFLICGTATAEAQFAVESMNGLGSRRLAVIDDGTSFPQTLGQATVDAAQAAGGVRVVAQLQLSQGAPNYAAEVARVLEAGADTVYFTGYYAEGNRLIRDLRDGGFTGKIMVGDGAVDTPLLEGLTGAYGEDVYGTTFLTPGVMPELADWSARYTRTVGHAPTAGAPEAYDAVKLALDAIRRAGSTDRAAVRRAIAETRDAALLSGDPRFNPDGTRVKPTFLLLTVRNDAFALVRSNQTD
jgi:branched-chain amino acid transport system substrate-binding protein